VVIYDFAIK